MNALASKRPELAAFADRWRPIMHATRHALRTAADGWMAGARATLPTAWVGAAFGGKDSLLLLEREDDGVRGHLVAGAVRGSVFIPEAAGCLPALDDWLHTIGQDRKRLRLGLVLEKSQCLGRSFVLPEAAVASLSSVLEQDILRRTPFELDEIWQAATLTRRTSNTRSVQQWIVRRDRARAAMAALGLAETDVDFLSIGAVNAVDTAIIALRGTKHGAPRPTPRLLRIAASLAVAATLVAVLAWDRSEGARLEALSQRVEAARAAARDGGGDPGALSAMVVRKSAPGMSRIWSELTRLLPDDTYLKTIRLADGSVTIDGFSSNAVDLVRIIDGSPLFVRAALVGSIEPNPVEGKDRFSLVVDLRAKRVGPRGSRHLAGDPDPTGLP